MAADLSTVIVVCKVWRPKARTSSYLCSAVIVELSDRRAPLFDAVLFYHLYAYEKEAEKKKTIVRDCKHTLYILTMSINHVHNEGLEYEFISTPR